MNLQQCISTKCGKFVCGNGGIIGFEPDPENVVIRKDSHMVLNHLFFPTKEGLTENINANLFDDIEGVDGDISKGGLKKFKDI